MQWFAVLAMVLVLLLVVGPSMLRMSCRSKAVQEHAAILMQGRESLSAQTFSNEFFPPKQQFTAEQIHELLKDVLIVDAAKVRPEDFLVADLGLGIVDGLEPIHLLTDIEKHFGISVTTSMSDQDPTVRQLVELVAETLKDSEQHESSSTPVPRP